MYIVGVGLQPWDILLIYCNNHLKKYITLFLRLARGALSIPLLMSMSDVYIRSFLCPLPSSLHSVRSYSLEPHGLQHTRLPCPSPTPRAYSNSCPLSWWCQPTISSFVVPFSSCLQSFPASGYFPMSQFFTSGGQNIGISASASVLLMNIQEWFPFG